jgi:hypothetical protein
MRAPYEGTSLLELSEETILRYLLEVDAPDWTQLEQHEHFGPRWVVFFLKRGRAISRASILDVYQNRSLRGHYPVNLALLRCKFTPAPLAINLIQYMRWMDLLNSLRIPTLSGPLRQKIELSLMESLPRRALGEKITLARQAPRGLVRHLRTVADRRVIRPLLTNYHFTYEDAMFIANAPGITPEVLEELALSRRWRTYQEVRRSLLLNTRTPRSMVYPLALTMSEHQIRGALKLPRLTTYTRRILNRVLEEKLYKKSGRPKARAQSPRDRRSRKNLKGESRS